MGMCISSSPAETLALGEAWSREARKGWVIGLTGELGSGKTQLVKGLARGLGIKRRIASPTFALINEYRESRLPLFHLDLYRLDTPEQIVAAGLDEYLFDPPGVAVVEWIERWLRQNTLAPGDRGPSVVKPHDYREVVIETFTADTRRFHYEDFGP
jgi:tRNA threonylcarbamoyladenosine biosynthesis protein TsaE